MDNENQEGTVGIQGFLMVQSFLANMEQGQLICQHSCVRLDIQYSGWLPLYCMSHSHTQLGLQLGQDTLNQLGTLNSSWHSRQQSMNHLHKVGGMQVLQMGTASQRDKRGSRYYLLAQNFHFHKVKGHLTLQRSYGLLGTQYRRLSHPY